MANSAIIGEILGDVFRVKVGEGGTWSDGSLSCFKDGEHTQLPYGINYYQVTIITQAGITVRNDVDTYFIPRASFSERLAIKLYEFVLTFIDISGVNKRLLTSFYSHDQ